MGEVCRFGAESQTYNGLHCYRAFPVYWPLKALYNTRHIHTLMADAVQSAHQEQFEVSFLPKDTLTDLENLGTGPATLWAILWLLDDLLYILSYSRLNNINEVKLERWQGPLNVNKTKQYEIVLSFKLDLFVRSWKWREFVYLVDMMKISWSVQLKISSPKLHSPPQPKWYSNMISLL